MSKSITVKYKGLEILCKPETIVKYRANKLPMSSVVITDDAIYKNIKKGNVASDKDITKAFGQKLELNDALDLMLQKGDFQLTTKERRELIDQRMSRLLEYFHTHYIDPTTNVAHPITRLQATFSQIKAKVNYEMPFDKNVELIRKDMLGVLPIKPIEVDDTNTTQTQTQTQPVKTSSAVKTSYGRKKGGKSRFTRDK
jgi:ribosome maturation protein Sdo1